MSIDETDLARERAERARVDLGRTLDAIEDRLDVGKQVRYYSGRAREAYRRNPLPWLAGAAAASLAAVGLVVWAFVSDD